MIHRILVAGNKELPPLKQQVAHLRQRVHLLKRGGVVLLSIACFLATAAGFLITRAIMEAMLLWFWIWILQITYRT